jgi:hypothetical protein
MKTLMGLVKALSVPLMLLNLFGGMASGIWLAVLRDWSTLGLGIGSFFVSTFILGIVLRPSWLLVGAYAAHFAEREKRLDLFSSFPSVAFTTSQSSRSGVALSCSCS